MYSVHLIYRLEKMSRKGMKCRVKSNATKLQMSTDIMNIYIILLHFTTMFHKEQYNKNHNII